MLCVVFIVYFECVAYNVCLTWGVWCGVCFMWCVYVVCRVCMWCVVCVLCMWCVVCVLYDVCGVVCILCVWCVVYV